MIIRTGKFFTADELARTNEAARIASSVPAIVVGQHNVDVYQRKTAAEIAQDAFRDQVNRAAVALGLPKPAMYEGAVVNYGFDERTGEILGWEPDAGITVKVEGVK